MNDIDNFQAITTDRLYIKIAEQLRGLIEKGVYKAGDRFPAERALAEKLGVSRPTIREAMIALELSGIIEIRTGSGIYVSNRANLSAPKLTDKGIGPFEILEMRYILESEICAIAATKITDEQVSRLYELIDEMEEEEKRPDASEQADGKFHLLIAEAAQNSALYESVKWLWDLRSKSVLSHSFFQTIRKEGIQPSIDDHKKIAFALEQRNPERASLAMKNHIENATVNAAKHFEK
ncbi:FadR/GntR family transcriptional regulator [Thalassotalea sp. PLHSN55]|uniref:FadR/GntR family transcriptional regulator n=1 Tax=Thalassotalea sp. PLHSN55 TaxID=3435888 RepID=UPI003F871E22